MSEPTRSDELIELAAVVRAHGLQGELLLKVFNRESELLHELSELVVRAPSGEERSYRVANVRGAADSTLLTLEGVRDRAGAEALRGSLLCVPRSLFPALEQGEYYLVDLVGLAVRNANAEVLGRVEQVIEYPSVECLLVYANEQWREVPDLPRYVLEVSIEGGYVVVDNLDELDPVPAPAPDRR